jgi:hypothetical protein
MMRQYSLNDDNLLPVKVTAFDRTKNIVTVQPLIKIVRMDGTTQSRNALAQIPALSIGGGGFHLSFPIKAGDLGWIFAADRDLSLFMQTLKENAPNTSRCHEFGDGFFIPDVLRQYVINAADATAAVLQSTDGMTRIAIDVGGVMRFTAPTSILFDTPTAHFTGSVQIDKNATINGTATITTDAIVAGISVKNHGHVQTAVAGQRTSNGMIT